MQLLIPYSEFLLPQNSRQRLGFTIGYLGRGMTSLAATFIGAKTRNSLNPFHILTKCLVLQTMIVQFYKSPLVLSELCTRWNLVNLPLKWGNFTVLSSLLNKRRRHIRTVQLSGKIASQNCGPRFCQRICYTRWTYPSNEGPGTRQIDRLWQRLCPPGLII